MEPAQPRLPESDSEVLSEVSEGVLLSTGVEALSSEESTGGTLEDSSGGILVESSGLAGSTTLTVKVVEGPSTEVKVMTALPSALAKTEPSA